jgi:two-component system, NarL family, invasion response regulator UvrY
MRILLTDDHALVRRGVAHILREEIADLTVTEAGTAQETLNAVQATLWDLVILDVNLPDKNGLEVLKDIKRMSPDLPVLILSLYPEAQYARRALKAGASGYITKDTAPEEVTSAVRRILQGGRYVSASLAEQLAADLGAPADDRRELHERLSDRELEVLRLIGRGHTPTEIAEQLAISIKTVSTYRVRILEKLERRTTAELIRFAVDHHLID